MAQFRSFAEILRGARESDAVAVVSEAVVPVVSPLVVAAADQQHRFDRALLEERVERAIARLLRDIAVDVLGRELRLAPVDVDAIVHRLRARFAANPFTNVTARDGDITIACAEGEIDASLGRRLEDVLERAS